MDDNPIANHCHTIAVNYTARQQMKVKLHVPDHYGVTRVITSLSNTLHTNKINLWLFSNEIHTI